MRGSNERIFRLSEPTVVFQIKCRSFSDRLLKSISSASKLRQWQGWRTEICAAKIRKFSRASEKSAASAKDLKNPRYRIVLVSDLLQIGFSPTLPGSSTSASSFDLNNYTLTLFDLPFKDHLFEFEQRNLLLLQLSDHIQEDSQEEFDAISARGLLEIVQAWWHGNLYARMVVIEGGPAQGEVRCHITQFAGVETLA